MIISKEKVKNSILKSIIDSNPDFFDEEAKDVDVFILSKVYFISSLVLFIFIEKKKGKESFYYPYFTAT